MGLGGKCRDKHVTDGVCFDKSKTDSEKQFLRILPGNVEVAAENLYGITSALLCEVQMSEYNQYDKVLLKDLEKCVEYARSKSLTDAQILRFSSKPVSAEQRKKSSKL